MKTDQNKIKFILDFELRLFNPIKIFDNLIQHYTFYPHHDQTSLELFSSTAATVMRGDILTFNDSLNVATICHNSMNAAVTDNIS